MEETAIALRRALNAIHGDPEPRVRPLKSRLGRFNKLAWEDLVLRAEVAAELRSGELVAGVVVGLLPAAKRLVLVPWGLTRRRTLRAIEVKQLWRVEGLTWAEFTAHAERQRRAERAEGNKRHA